MIGKPGPPTAGIGSGWPALTQGTAPATKRQSHSVVT